VRILDEIYGDFSFLPPRVRMYEGLWRERVRGALEMFLSRIWGMEGF